VGQSIFVLNKNYFVRKTVQYIFSLHNLMVTEVPILLSYLNPNWVVHRDCVKMLQTIIAKHVFIKQHTRDC